LNTFYSFVVIDVRRDPSSSEGGERISPSFLSPFELVMMPTVLMQHGSACTTLHLSFEGSDSLPWFFSELFLLGLSKTYMIHVLGEVAISVI